MFTRIQLRIILFSMLAGGIFGHLQAIIAVGAAGVADDLRGVIDGGLIAFALSSFGIALDTRWAAPLRQAPFLVLLTARSLVYLVVIVLGILAGVWLVPAPELVSPLGSAALLFSLALAIGFNLFFGINQLLGQGVLFNFVAGRYHRPRLETRALLFVDMESSTAIAERLGEVRFLVLLNRFVGDLTLAIAGEGGEIHKYVGDEVIATWRLGREGAARAVRACFAARARFAARAADYQREFGHRPDFRAALHLGPVVIGELGLLKMEIALLGDTMNTAARILEACRDTGNPTLASGALIEQIADLPPGLVSRALGLVRLRGKETALPLYALEEPAPRAPAARGAAAS
jgi:adenylate cyclase